MRLMSQGARDIATCCANVGLTAREIVPMSSNSYTRALGEHDSIIPRNVRNAVCPGIVVASRGCTPMACCWQL